MRYHSIIKGIQHDTGFSKAESEEAVGRLVEEITERLGFDDKMELARVLPSELQEIVLAVSAAPKEVEVDRTKDIFVEYMEKEDITREKAQERLLGAWYALKSLMGLRIVRNFKEQLPDSTAQMLS